MAKTGFLTPYPCLSQFNLKISFMVCVLSASEYEIACPKFTDTIELNTKGEEFREETVPDTGWGEGSKCDWVQMLSRSAFSDNQGKKGAVTE